MEKYLVDQDLCIGCGMCAGICPAVFRIGEYGKAEVDQNGDVNDPAAETASGGCPVGAISKRL